MSDLPDCWARLQSELAPQIPPEAVTINEFVDATPDVSRAVAERHFSARIEAGILQRAKKGRNWYYWPSDSNP